MHRKPTYFEALYDCTDVCLYRINQPRLISYFDFRIIFK